MGIKVVSSIPAVERTRRARPTRGSFPARLVEQEEPRASAHSIPVGVLVEGVARGTKVVEVRVEATSASDVVAVVVVGTAAEVVAHPSSRRVPV